MSDYADLDSLINGYLPSISSDADKVTLAGMITRASRAIDSRTRRQANAFVPAPEERSEQVFYGAESPVLLLPDFVAGSVESVTAPTGHMPPGYAEFRRREVTTGALRVGLHTATTGGILTPRVTWRKGVPFTVLARWGFAETPGEITEGTLQLVRIWWTQQPGNLSGPTGDIKPWAVERGFPKMVDELIAPYVLQDVVEESTEGTIEVGELLNSDVNPWRDF